MLAAVVLKVFLIEYNAQKEERKEEKRKKKEEWEEVERCKGQTKIFLAFSQKFP